MCSTILSTSSSIGRLSQLQIDIPPVIRIHKKPSVSSVNPSPCPSPFEENNDFKVLDFCFNGSQKLGFSLNIGTDINCHMAVKEVKPNGQAEKLGLLTDDVLFAIDDVECFENWKEGTDLLRSYVANSKAFNITFIRRNANVINI